MRAPTTYPSNGSKVTKIAIVSLLHLGVALAMISMKVPLKPTARIIHPINILPIPAVIEEREKIEVDTTTAAAPLPVLPVIHTLIETEEPVTQPLPDPGPPLIATADPGITRGIAGKGRDGPVIEAAKQEKVHMAALANAGDCARPDYPARAARNGDSGTVSLALLIGVDGRVSEAKIKQSSGFRDLDRAAIAALSMCKFKPATTNGVAEPAWGQIAYVWSLAD